MDELKYQQALIESMQFLAKEDKIIFLGQNLIHSGCPMYSSLLSVDRKRIIELPVIEDTQMGMSVGLALEGFIPVTCYPRIDFMLCAANQLINHLDKVEQMSHGEFKPGIIIRTQIGNSQPLNPGPQHCGDYTEGFQKMLKMEVIKLDNPEKILESYKLALSRAKEGKSTLLVEIGSGPWQIKQEEGKK